MCAKSLISLEMVISLSLIDSQPGNDPQHSNLACSSEALLRSVCLPPLPLQMTTVINICLCEYFLVCLLFNRGGFCFFCFILCVFHAEQNPPD